MATRKQKWEAMKLEYVGDIEDVMQGGINGPNGPAYGKTVPAAGDPGEPTLKPRGQE